MRSLSIAHKKIEGMTLLEFMLVLVIAASMILLGVQLYRSYEQEKNYFILRANVDFLFHAMKGYYHTECDLYFTEQGALQRQGKLTFNPNNKTPATALGPILFDISTVNAYMTNAWPRYTPVIDNPDTTNSYKAQFNPTEGGEKNVYYCSYFGSGSPLCGTSVIKNPSTSSSVILWQSQIVVRMKDPKKTLAYIGVAGADCAINADLSAAILPPVNCDVEGVKSGDATHMVWQRTASFSPITTRSPHWMSNPMLKQFKLLYTHDPMYELYKPSNTTTTDIYKYYYCGG